MTFHGLLLYCILLGIYTIEALNLDNLIQYFILEKENNEFQKEMCNLLSSAVAQWLVTQRMSEVI